MTALYANTSERREITRAGNGYCALARIGNHADIIRIQDTLRMMLGGGEVSYLAPSEFHITLVYASGGDAERLQQLWPSLDKAFGVLVDSVGVFETPDGYAVYLAVRPAGSIIDLQRGLWSAFAESGFDISPYSDPSNYKPHITLAYSPAPFAAPIPIAPFPVVVSSIELCDPTEKPIVISHMRSAGGHIRSVNPAALRAIYHEAEGELEGYLAVWGSPTQRDAYNTWFDAKRPPDLGLKNGRFLPIRLMYEHGQDGDVRKEIIGEIYEIAPDGNGIRFWARLDRNSPNFEKAVQELRNRELGMSSASAEHLAEFDSEGRFVNWYLSEASLTKTPAEARMPAVTLVRSTPDKNIPASDQLDARGVLRAPGSGSDGASNSFETQKGKPTMGLTLEQLGIAPTASLEDVLKALTDAVGPDAAAAMLQTMLGGGQTPPSADNAEGQDTTMSMPPEQRSAPAPQTSDSDVATLRADIAALRAQMVQRMTGPAPEPQTQRGDRRAPQISVNEPLRYAHLRLNDLTFAHMVLRSQRLTPSNEFMQILGGRAATAIEKGESSMTTPFMRSLMPSTRANEIAISTAAGGGDEWVAIEWSSQIWETARANRIYQQLVSKGMRVEEVPQGKESIYILTEGADPTVYTIAQNADLSSGRPPVNVAATRIGTGRQLLTPGELGMAVVYSDVFEEDSFIPVANQYNFQMSEKAEETIEQLMLNGDTTASANTNINLIDGTPGTGTSTPYYIASNGMLYYALVTGSGTSRDGGALDENDFRLTLKLMPAAIRTRKQNIAYVIDSDTHNTALNIAAIKTDDVRVTNATIKSGVLTNIYGVDVLESGFMPLANSAGKVPAAGGTLGRILCVYAPYWAMGWKRRIRIETDRDILSGDNIIVAKMRLGFVARGAGASTVSYNLTIA